MEINGETEARGSPEHGEECVVEAYHAGPALGAVVHVRVAEAAAEDHASEGLEGDAPVQQVVPARQRSKAERRGRWGRWITVSMGGGVVWCGVVWCGVVRCGVVWCGRWDRHKIRNKAKERERSSQGSMWASVHVDVPGLEAREVEGGQHLAVAVGAFLPHHRHTVPPRPRLRQRRRRRRREVERHLRCITMTHRNRQ